MSELRDLQETFWAAISAPAGVPARLARRLRVDPERLDVYANMYFYRLRDNLALDFPVLSKALGPERFHNLITDYLLAHPSRDPNVRNVGRSLPGFLEPSWLADLAALEWARLDVFDRADDVPLRDLAVHARDGFQHLSLRAVHAHQVVQVQHVIEPVWRAQDGHAPERHPHAVLVWRKDCVVHHRPLDTDEASLWPCVQRGISFTELCARLAFPAERAAERALQLVVSWTTSELLVALPA